MKMTPTWEEKDVTFGLIVYCHCDGEDKSYMLSTAHIIGYFPNRDDKKYAFVSLSDGLTINYTLSELLSILNRQPYVPMPSTYLAKTMKYKVPKV